MLETFLGRRSHRPRLSRAAAAVATDQVPRRGATSPTSNGAARRSSTQLGSTSTAAHPPRRPQPTTGTSRRALRVVTVAELFALAQQQHRQQLNINNTNHGYSNPEASLSSSSDRTWAILDQMLSGCVLVSDHGLCCFDFGEDYSYGAEELPRLAADSCCPICLVDWQHGEFVACPRVCKHVFHVQCLAQWLDATESTIHKKKECPCCRVPLDPTPPRQPQHGSQEITTRLRLPSTWDSQHHLQNTHELDVDSVIGNMSEMAVADGGRRTPLTYFRLPDQAVRSIHRPRRFDDDPPSFTSDDAVVGSMAAAGRHTNPVDLDDEFSTDESMEDPHHTSSRPRPPLSGLKKRLRPWLESERGAPPESPRNTCLRVGPHDVVRDSSGSRRCALCRGPYEATSRYTVSQDLDCPHLYHEECWLEFACRYLLEHDDEDNDADREDDLHAAVDRNGAPQVGTNVAMRSVPCVCCHRPFLCVPADVVVMPNRNKHNPRPQRRRRLPSF